jgi:hypothetical protein
MSPPRLPRAATGPARSPESRIRFAQSPTARRSVDDDWDDDDPQGDAAEHIDPDLLDDDEPQPEPGDFWLEPDDDDV